MPVCFVQKVVVAVSAVPIRVDAVVKQIDGDIFRGSGGDDVVFMGNKLNCNWHGFGFLPIPNVVNIIGGTFPNRFSRFYDKFCSEV